MRRPWITAVMAIFMIATPLWADTFRVRVAAPIPGIERFDVAGVDRESGQIELLVNEAQLRQLRNEGHEPIVLESRERSGRAPTDPMPEVDYLDGVRRSG